MAKEQNYEVVKPYSEAEVEAHSGKVGGKRNLREVVIRTEDGYEFHYLVKKPSRAVMQAIAENEQKKDLTAVQKLMLGCVLEGDKEAYEYDGAIYTELLENIGRLVDTAKSEVKKL